MISVRKTTEADLDAILGMIQELADYENFPNGPQLTRQDLIRDGGFNGSKPVFHSLVVEELVEGQSPTTIGYSIGYFTFSPALGKSFFLEDLYIQPEHRKKKAGFLLFREVAKFALETNCSRMLWHVLDWNQLAIDFYNKIGGTDLTSTENGLQYFRFSRPQIEGAPKCQ